MNSVNGKSILVADDDVAMLRALSKVLSGEGACVAQATGAEQALRQLADACGRFDLVITDLCMPNAAAARFLHEVRAAFPEVPVMIVTAFGSPELRNQCLCQGAAAFLEKPVCANALLAGIARVFSSCRHKA